MDHPLVVAARALAPEVLRLADETERGRRLSPALVAAFTDAGLFRMLVPAAIGGGEVDAATMVRAIEAVAIADGAAGWCVMVAATTGMLTAYLAEEHAREIVGPGARTPLAGVVAPRGVATPVPGGLRVTGRWPFASGCQHAGWIAGGFMVLEDGVPRRLPGGGPDARLALFPASECEVLDTWHVAGLRGTGSHDFAVEGALVPEGRTVSLLVDRPRAAGPLYSFPLFGLLALGVAAVALGIARASIDALLELAAVKTPLGARGALRERSTVQAEVARAEAALRAARAFVFESVDAAWADALSGKTITTGQLVLVRLASTHATEGAARVVDAMYRLGGGSSIYASSPLQRRFRDIHVATQHVMVAESMYGTLGRALLGLPVDRAAL